jgi:outer membrane lipoprotein SlyB
MSNSRIWAKSAMALAALGLAAAPNLAQARYYSHHHYHHYRTCGASRRAHGNVGTVVGGVGGGIVGNAVTHGSFLGTVVGAGAGAVVGHHIGKHSTRC